MILTIKPVKVLKGEVVLPSSKSYSIRAFMIASCGGDSSIIHPSNCDDAVVARRTAQALGAKVQTSSKNVYRVRAQEFLRCHCEPRCTSAGAMTRIINPSTMLRVDAERSRSINVKESGTVLRFLLPLISLDDESAVVTGEGTLRQRPNHHLTEALRRMGVSIRGKGKEETVPIHKKTGHLHGGAIEIDGSLSSQFISALLIACPCLKEDTRLKVAGKKLVSQTYITMTKKILAKSGIRIQQKSPRLFYVKGNQKYKGLKNFTVPADYGLAAFFLAAGALISSKIVLRGYFPKDFIQADAQILKFLKQMGVKFDQQKDAIKISGPFPLKAGNFSLKNCPDLLPIMAVLGLFAKGPMRLYDIGHARVKESDRIGDLKNELLKIGANLKDTSDELVIHPREHYRKDCLLDPHHDHRLAMAFSILGLKIGVGVKDIECTRKSYPDFVKDLKSIVRQKIV